MNFTPRQLFSRAVNDVMKNDPFLATIIMKMNHIEDESIVPVMMTNGKILRFNPKLVATYTQDELGWIIRHEAFHIANGHTIRQAVIYKAMKQSSEYGSVIEKNNITENDIHMLFNIACDLAINELLVAGRFKGLPKDALLVARGDFIDIEEHNKSCEYYFYKLFKKQQEKRNNNKKEKNQDSNQQGEGKDKEEKYSDKYKDKMDVEAAPSNVNIDKELQDLQQNLVEAMTIAKEAGKLPSYCEKIIEDITKKSDICWKAELRMFIRKSIRKIKTYRRTSRRISSDFIMPGKKRHGLGKVVFASDMSGSMPDYLCLMVYSEMEKIFREFPEVELTFLAFDTDILAEKKMTASEFPIKNKKRYGYGGTMFRPMIDRINELNPVCAIVLTDLLLCDDYGENPSVPYIWLATDPYVYSEKDSRYYPPWGRVRAVEA